MDVDRDALPLNAVIQTLRAELKQAVEAADTQALKLRVSSIELEMKVVVSRQKQAGGGVKFWVLNAEAAGSMSTEHHHTLRLTLDPVLPEGGELLVNDSIDRLPKR